MFVIVSNREFQNRDVSDGIQTHEFSIETLVAAKQSSLVKKNSVVIHHGAFTLQMGFQYTPVALIHPATVIHLRACGYHSRKTHVIFRVSRMVSPYNTDENYFENSWRSKLRLYQGSPEPVQHFSPFPRKVQPLREFNSDLIAVLIYVSMFFTDLKRISSSTYYKKSLFLKRDSKCSQIIQVSPSAQTIRTCNNTQTLGLNFCGLQQYHIANVNFCLPMMRGKKKRKRREEGNGSTIFWQYTTTELIFKIKGGETKNRISRQATRDLKRLLEIFTEAGTVLRINRAGIGELVSVAYSALVWCFDRRGPSSDNSASVVNRCFMRSRENRFLFLFC
ncbi:hypothetical protein VP01_652g1 [Puccinia sorghi]|uniref:Uncharacterized protein n=1 Tax=Puccinia sorghi TaxID=27349 RepID=A0A0L6UFH2_9BASI|nr:hypothetical protein VP01_652g1 [Puccinia sorghi]